MVISYLLCNLFLEFLMKHFDVVNGEALLKTSNSDRLQNINSQLVEPRNFFFGKWILQLANALMN